MNASSTSAHKVFVLGGSRGIGAAIVRRFARDGADVSFTYFASSESAGKLADETHSSAIKLDSSDRNALIATLENHEPIHTLVINAGVLVFGDPLQQSPDDIDHLFQVNINAPYHAAISAARKMPHGGRIIFIGSTNADRVPMEGIAAYSASKAAIKGLVKGLARDFGARGITVNVVQPGPTDTDMNPADGPLKDVMHDFMAIKRHATGDEVAAMVAWLASPEADMVTGAALAVDGGFAG